MANILSALGIVCALGNDQQSVWQAAIKGQQGGLKHASGRLVSGRETYIGELDINQLASVEHLAVHYQTRNNRLALSAYQQLAAEVEKLRDQYRPERIAVVIGTSTSGIAAGEAAQRVYQQQQRFPDDYHYQMQEMSSAAYCIAEHAGLRGPIYAISTACSSSAKAMISAAALLDADLADAVVVGGVDSICEMTLNGFDALESVSSSRCNPFSRHRDGINIGEAAALFIMQRGQQGIALAGYGASSDAHHMSAPDPQGQGAISAIQAACRQAGLAAKQLDYINLHGTATPLNDQMESHVLQQLDAAQVPASASKALTGHTLGAAGALEAALCWLTLSPLNASNELIPHIYDGDYDPELAPIALVKRGQRAQQLRYCLSNSFAFGGSNTALLLQRLQ